MKDKKIKKEKKKEETVEVKKALQKYQGYVNGIKVIIKAESREEADKQFYILKNIK